MKSITKKLGAAILVGTCLSTPAHAGDLYAFGDAVADNGNIPKLTGIDYPPPPYYGNRFSNGPVWPEYFPGLTGLGFTASHDYAVGGAFAGPLTIDGISYDNLGNVPPILGRCCRPGKCPAAGVPGRGPNLCRHRHAFEQQRRGGRLGWWG